MFSDHILLKIGIKYIKTFENRNSETNHFIILIPYKQVEFVLIMCRKTKMDFKHEEILTIKFLKIIHKIICS